MAYTATKYLSVKPFPFPKGQDNTQRNVIFRGKLVENDTATFYTTGGIGQSSFEVTAFSAVGLVTYTALKGQPLVNGQKVVIFNTASNTNDGTYIVSQVTPTTFVAIPAPTPLSGSAQTTQTAQGVGGFLFGCRQLIPQTFTATAVALVAGGFMKVTYTTLVGPQLQPGDPVILAGMTHAGNNGPFSIVSASPTSSTGGSFIVQNPNAVATDSGTGKGTFQAGADFINVNEAPIEPVIVESSKGFIYKWDAVNQTIRIYMTGASSGTVLTEAALGASVAFDGTITCEAAFSRSVNS